MTTRLRRLGAALATAGFALALAACTAQEGSSDTTSEGSASASATSSTGGDAPLAECIVGTWDADESLLPPNNVQAEEGVDVSGSGTLTLTFDETTVTVLEQTEVSFSGTDEERGTVVLATITDGTATLTYTLAEDTITYGELVSAEGTITSSTTLEGQEPTTEETEYSESVGSQAGKERGISCAGDTLTLTQTLNDTTAEAVYHRR